MNKKILNTVLVIAVVGLWFAISKKYTGNSRVERAELPSSNQEVKMSVVKKGFSLNLSYDDPFALGRFEREPKPIVPPEEPNLQPTIKKEKKEIIQWPEILYLGAVTNSNSQVETVILNINGSSVLMQDTINMGGETLVIEEITPDSISVQYQKDIRWIKRN